MNEDAKYLEEFVKKYEIVKVAKIYAKVVLAGLLQKDSQELEKTFNISNPNKVKLSETIEITTNSGKGAIVKIPVLENNEKLFVYNIGFHEDGSPYDDWFSKE